MRGYVPRIGLNMNVTSAAGSPRPSPLGERGGEPREVSLIGVAVMAGERCELCDVAAGMACKDCHFYRHYESMYRIRAGYSVVLFKLTPKGKFHIQFDDYEAPPDAACGRRRRG